VILLGELSLWVALLTSAWAAIVLPAGAATGREDLRASGLRALVASFAMLLLANAGLITALVRREFAVAYVAAQSARTLPDPYAVAALWSGQSGSLLLWAAMIAGCAAIAARHRCAGDTGETVASTVLAAICLLLVAALCLSMNPFGRLAFVVPEGLGLNPQLRHPAMLLHPPIILFGYAATTMPFALALGALGALNAPAHTASTLRRWTLIAWIALGAGLLLGMWWAYDELGWGGVWAWDPVQNAALVPWLAATASLHQLRLQERRGRFSRVNLVVAALPFVLVTLGAFIDRGAVLPSIHAFARPAEPVWFGVLLGSTILALAGFTIAGARRVTRARTEQTWLDALASTESGLVIGGALLLATAFAVLWGTLFPLLSSWVHGTSVSVGAAYFVQVTSPLLLLLAAAIACVPLLGWRATSRATLRKAFAAAAAAIVVIVTMVATRTRDLFTLIVTVVCVSGGVAILLELWNVWRKRKHAASKLRTIGGLLAHGGVLLICVAFVGARFRSEFDAVLQPGQVLELSDPLGGHWRFVSQGASIFSRASHHVTAVSLDVERNGKPLGLLTSEKRQYLDVFGEAIFLPSTEVDSRTTLRTDVQLVLVNLEGETATVRVLFHPFLIWLWIGGAFVLIGGALTLRARTHAS
jgi:cytochrome c-type biogenesis protein CcmF